MLMKRWRVGSLSMGLILVAFGVLLLVSLITRIDVLNVIYMLSPIVLICLGAEILLHLFVKGDGGEIKIKYDFLSIVFVSVILLIGAGVYVMTGLIGFFETKEDMYAAFGIRNKTVYKEYSMEFDDADEIALFNWFNSLQILPSDTDKIKIEYFVQLNTNDKEYADSIMDKTVKIDNISRRICMTANPAGIYNDRKISYPVISCVVYLPENKIADVSQCRWGYEIVVDNRIKEENIIRPDER